LTNTVNAKYKVVKNIKLEKEATSAALQPEVTLRTSRARPQS